MVGELLSETDTEDKALPLPVCVPGIVVATAVPERVDVAQAEGVSLGLPDSVPALDVARGVPDTVRVAVDESDALVLMVSEEVGV